MSSLPQFSQISTMFTLKIVSSRTANVGSSKAQSFCGRLMAGRWPIKLVEIKVLCGDTSYNRVGKTRLSNSFGRWVNPLGNHFTQTDQHPWVVDDQQLVVVDKQPINENIGQSMTSQWSKPDSVCGGTCRM